MKQKRIFSDSLKMQIKFQRKLSVEKKCFQDYAATICLSCVLVPVFYSLLQHPRSGQWDVLPPRGLAYSLSVVGTNKHILLKMGKKEKNANSFAEP